MKKVNQKPNNPAISMDMVTARQMLDNVLNACDYEQVTVPLDVLSSYSSYRRERFLLQKIIVIIMVVLFVLLPLLFISPGISMTADDSLQESRLWISVDSVIPIKSITAMMDGKKLPVYEVNSHEYIVQPPDNGDLDVKVVLINRQETTATYSVSALDDEAPAYVSFGQEGNSMLFYFTDAGSGIDGKSLRVMDAENEQQLTSYWDEERGCAVVDYPGSMVNLYIADKSGNILHVKVMPQ